jgi:cell division protein ZapA
MAELALQIGGRAYSVTCRDGEEAHLTALAAKVDGKTAEARAAVGDTSEVRQLLFAALLLADELLESAPAAPPPAPPANDDGLADALDQLADRVERIATRLENPA